MTIAEILLWLFVINLGIAFGAGLYEQSIIRFTRLDSHVRVNGDAQYRRGPKILGLRHDRSAYPCLRWQVLSSLGQREVRDKRGSSPQRSSTLVERVATFAYFIPAALKLMRAETLPAANAEAMASRWKGLNHVRSALALVGWLAALKALSLSG